VRYYPMLDNSTHHYQGLRETLSFILIMDDALAGNMNPCTYHTDYTDILGTLFITFI